MSRKLIDIQGRIFGQLTVLGRTQNTKGAAQWDCVCACGTKCTKWGHNLRAGGTVSCGCHRNANRHKRQIDIRGVRFGMLVATSLVPRDAELGGISRWICVCDCGTVKAIRLDHLKTSATVSCGCIANKGPTLAWRPQHIRQSASVKDHIRRSRKGDPGNWFSVTEIEELLRKQKKRCANCFGRITMDTMHKDHRVPLSRGGDNRIANIQLLCVPCNRRKYNKDPIDFAWQTGRLL